jgi:predicted TIM-barrel fold metal-dependent hydrolase
MIIDCHVHISACTPGHGSMSSRLLNSIPFRAMRWKFGLVGNDERTERALEGKLVELIAQTPELDAVALLAFDAVYDRDGRIDQANTHLYVTNDYVIELAARHREILFAASVHPYRKDAVAEVERSVRRGAVLMKWLPIVQGFDPSDPICIPFYEALAHYGLPLLSHTGSEQCLPNLMPQLADPALLRPALDRGVTVIMAHCGTRATPWATDYVPAFMRMAREHEHCYGDTSALNIPARWYAFDQVLNDPVVANKLVHGSDWPVLVLPPPRQLGLAQALQLIYDEPNWLRRDVLIKKRLGFDAAYWQRAAKVLRMSGGAESKPTEAAAGHIGRSG